MYRILKNIKFCGKQYKPDDTCDFGELREIQINVLIDKGLIEVIEIADMPNRRNKIMAKTYKILSDIMYCGKGLPVGAKSDLKALKPETIAKLEKEGLIIDVEKAIEELTGKDVDEVISEQAKKIIADAKIEASKIIAEAKADAEKIRSEAKKDKK